MPSISRATLPQNFLDSVSPGMRLPTPEPQYWFAKAALGGRISLAALNAGAPTAQQFVSMAGSGQVLPPGLDEMARAADAYPGTVMAVDDFGRGAGDTIKFRRDVYSTGGLTESDRELNGDVAISTTGQAIQMEEVPVVLKEYHGPFASGASAVQPYAIKDFDAKFRAAKESLASATSRFLGRDYVRWLDTVIRNRFRACSNITYASDSVSNVLSYTNGAGHVANLEMIMRARKSLSDREWPKFSNGRYVCLVPTKFNVDMVGDVDYRELSKVHTDKNQLFGYIGSVQDVDLFEVSTLATYAAGSTVPGDGQVVPANVTVQEALMFGPGAVGFGTALAPECRWADDTNYGTIAKCIWYAIHAFQTLNTDGVQRILFQ